MKYSYEKDMRITGEYDPPLSVPNSNPTEADLQKLKELEEKYRKMKENRDTAAVIPNYPDIIPTHPDWSDVDYEKHIAEELDKAKRCADWPDI